MTRLPRLLSLRRLSLLCAALAALIIIAIAPPAPALDLGKMSGSERADFDAAVRQYLVNHPEVLVEAMQALDAKQADARDTADKTLVQKHRTALFSDPNAWVSGNPAGDVTLVEFMDYRCGYCRKAYEEVRDLVKSDGKIRFIVKEFPILGPQSVQAARFALAVKMTSGDAAYGQVHDALMTFRGEMTEPAFRALATKLDLNTAKVMAKMDSPEVTQAIQSNLDLGQAMQVNGTPTFVMGDHMLRGYVSGAQMAELVSAARIQ